MVGKAMVEEGEQATVAMVRGPREFPQVMQAGEVGTLHNLVSEYKNEQCRGQSLLQLWRTGSLDTRMPTAIKQATRTATHSD